MKTSPLAVAGIICMVLAGCRTDPSVALLERQNRILEDENYRLRGVIQDYEEGGTPVDCTTGDVVESAPAAGETWKSRESIREPDRSSSPRGRKSSTRQTVPPPIVEMPGEAQPPGEIPDTLKRPAGTPAQGEPDKPIPPEVPKQIEGPTGPSLPGPRETERSGARKIFKIRPTSGFEPVAKADSKDVKQLVLNRMLTGGFGIEGETGDKGVLVVLQPRDAMGRRLEAPGDVSVVLLDPTKPGDKARLARWEFSASETAKLFSGSGIGRGMYVECLWPDSPPENSRLHLFARYTTRDGRQMQVDQPVEIALPGERVSRWTPAETETEPVHASTTELVSSQSDEEDYEASQPTDSPDNDSATPRRQRSVRNASRIGSGKIQRPTWSPERF